MTGVVITIGFLLLLFNALWLCVYTGMIVLDSITTDKKFKWSILIFSYILFFIQFYLLYVCINASEVSDKEYEEIKEWVNSGYINETDMIDMGVLNSEDNIISHSDYYKIYNLTVRRKLFPLTNLSNPVE